MTRSLNDVAVGLFLAIYLSVIAWYDLRILSSRGFIEAVDVSQYLLVWAGALLPFLLFFCAHLVKASRALIVCLAFYGVYVAASAVGGYWSGNPTRYLAGDLFKALMLPAGVGLFLLMQDRVGAFYRLLFWIGFAYITIRFVFFLTTVQSVAELYYGISRDSLLAALAIVSLTQVHGPAHGTLLGSRIAPAAALVMILAGGKRMVLIGLIATVAQLTTLKRLALLGLAGLVIGAALLSVVDIPLLSRLKYFADPEILMQVEARRIQEVLSVLTIWPSSFTALLFGNGFGAEAPVWFERSNNLSIFHSIHNTAAATALRSGMAGLVVYFGIVLCALWNWRNQDVRVERIVLITLFICSQFSYGFMDEVLVGFMFARLITAQRAEPVRPNHVSASS